MELIEEKGFSPTKMVVVVAIIGMILAVVIPSFIVMAPRMRLQGSVRYIVSDIQNM